MTIIGISGKIGSGKNFLANLLMEELNKRGYKTSEASFATPLKNELTDIINLVKELNKKNQPDNIIVAAITTMYQIPVNHSEQIFDFIKEDIIATPEVDGYSRTEGIRRALQYLGTDVRRKSDNDYWVKRFHEQVNDFDGYVFVTDVRFPNEADSIVDHGGKVLRLEPPAEVVAERTELRDGMKYSSSAHQHVSETALDDYPKFILTITETSFDIPKIVDSLIK